MGKTIYNIILYPVILKGKGYFTVLYICVTLAFFCSIGKSDFPKCVFVFQMLSIGRAVPWGSNQLFPGMSSTFIM